MANILGPFLLLLQTIPNKDEKLAKELPCSEIRLTSTKKHKNVKNYDDDIVKANYGILFFHFISLDLEHSGS